MGQVIGQKRPIIVRNYDSKLLCSISLSRTDANYLDEICRELAARRVVLREVLLSYWESLRAHVSYGQALMATVDKRQLLKRLAKYERSISGLSKFDKNAIAFCTPDTEAHLAEFLVIVHHRFGGLPSIEQSRKDKSIPTTIKSTFQLPTPPELRLPGEWRGRAGAYRTQIRWMLGRLLPRDIAVLSALLIMESPKFTPEAITSAKLFDENGQRFVEFTDSGERFSVAKHRAKSVKTATLSILSRAIIKFASECSPDIRSQLRAAGSPIADLMFIPCVSRGGGVAVQPAHEPIVTFLSGLGGESVKPWLGDVFPKLVDAGLTRGTVSFSRIRNTEGVLEWYRTGSIGDMSRKLGNTDRTCIDHYLPPALLQAWNTRLIRRFQNLWICVSAASEDWLLEVTDFSTVEELHAFINDMLVQHDRFSSPLAAQLHERFGGEKLHANMAGSGSEKTWLAVAISKNSLAALYLYLDISLTLELTDDVLNYEDNVTHTTPRQFIDLALLLSQRLPNENNPIFVQLHNEARQIARSLVTKVRWRTILFR
ncbi:hypothetical protein [Paraburkholderia sp. 32]|uniref:hypothetical protein n=1 Tax=Paraburkholderia sp. 32 TaxID=2991057 RepID=UPI003D250FB7